MIEMDQDSGATQILSVSTFYRLVRLFVEKVLLYFREYFYAILHRHGDEDKINPRSVNYHFTRKCNYKCAFCFHTSKTSFVMPADEAKRGLKMLKDAGMEKINFSGGEPFVHSKGKYLGELMMHCKTVLRLDSVSVVSNGSLISEDWMAKYAEYLDVLAISCDSFDAGTNDAIGRFQNKRTDHIGQLRRIRDWCLKYDVMFKINTVVNTANLDEDMSDHILRLQPARWKVFQCLLIDGENVGSNALRQAEKFYVSDDEFETFVRCHSRVPTLVVEDNRHMRDSYLILDEYMRFLNCRNNKKEPSKSILDVGVADALKCSGFDEQAFLERGGVYTWSKSKSAPAPALADDKLDW